MCLDFKGHLITIIWTVCLFTGPGPFKNQQKMTGIQVNPYCGYLVFNNLTVLAKFFSRVVMVISKLLWRNGFNELE